MALKEYNKKRSFPDSPEPTGGRPLKDSLRFVVQKHDASRLHYDFRLEMDGVLKSWAVPKGPSLNPEDRRLAMQVEDHPYDYRNFEGQIPEGNYGAGTVIVWDEGTYESLEPQGSKAKEEKLLLHQLETGSLKFSLHGKKLRGEFALVHIKNNGKSDNAWLLIKHRDAFASETDITKKDKSVISGKSLAAIEKKKDAPVWQSNRKKASSPTPAKADKPVRATAKKSTTVKSKSAPRKKKTSGKRAG